MTAVAVELPLELEAGPRTLPKEPDADPSGEIESWELHSELVLVCPEVCARALELLPERDPDAFLVRPERAIVVPARSDEESEPAPGLPAAAAVYACWRIADTARRAVVAVGLLAAVALLAEVVH